jgi:hypothetical protein
MAEEQNEAAARERILSHMNADHETSLISYLRVYCKVAPKASYTVKMENITLSGMVINYNGLRYSVAFTPPMSSLLEARQRLVEMHSHCLKTLGMSDITIRRYTFPKGFQAVVFGLCLSTYISFSRANNFRPGSILYSYIFGYFPRFAALCASLQRPVLAAMIAIHVVESYLMATKVLRPHKVPMFSGLWWKWMASTFIEGFGAFQRTKILVKKEQARIDEIRSKK